MAVKILSVERRSPAQRAHILAGETLCSINGSTITDVLDYRFYMVDERLLLELLDKNGVRREVLVQKGEYDELGLEFETYLMDKQHTCKNKCIFCFIDQMPPNMRESLYIKDDDARMSFLFGNYITLTNLCDDDIERIIKMHISPVNISVHTTNPALRVQMMKNPTAGEALRYLKRLAECDIKINTQLVLCPGINDGSELRRTITDLADLYPAVQSIACVPVGLTRFRDGLTALRTYSRDEASQVLLEINRLGDALLKRHGDRLVYPADEFFLLAQQEVPNADYYGEFNQLENGVGLLALLGQEFDEALEEETQRYVGRRVSIATGVAAGEFIKGLVKKAQLQCEGLNCSIEVIQNVYFGSNITVAGLITATDLIAQLKGKDLGDELLISSAMLRHEQDKFLDDYTVRQLQAELGVKVTVVDNDGRELLYAVLGVEQ
ncbi:MAG: DUF512 domain-containing protein [Hydrogenoanaerobacterium sp.]